MIKIFIENSLYDPLILQEIKYLDSSNASFIKFIQLYWQCWP